VATVSFVSKVEKTRNQLKKNQFYYLQGQYLSLQLYKTCVLCFQSMLQCDSVTCEPGFTCSSTTSGQCVRTYCADEPPVLAYGNIRGNFRDIGSRRRYKCDYGPEYGVDVSITTCKDDGQWSVCGEMLCHPFGNQLFDVYMPQDTRYPSNVNITTASLIECVKECSLQPLKCLSVNYHASSGECHFSTLAKFKLGSSIGNQFGWTVVQKILPIFMARHLNNLKYQLTKNMAIERCLDLGTSIATFGDVTNAYNKGFFACRCGYVLDMAYALFYMRLTRPDSDCGVEGLNFCRFHMAEVYCKATNFVQI